MSRELLVDLFGVIDVVRQEGSVIRVLNYDELAKDKTKLEIEVSKYRGEYEDVSVKYVFEYLIDWSFFFFKYF